ncbi:hypothetical protein DA101_015870 [Sinorhizobium meliloti]|nr:hypothetical protein DA101_015870 [Sinorhizobium meliloti]
MFLGRVDPKTLNVIVPRSCGAGCGRKTAHTFPHPALRPVEIWISCRGLFDLLIPVLVTGAERPLPAPPTRRRWIVRRAWRVVRKHRLAGVVSGR